VVGSSYLSSLDATVLDRITSGQHMAHLRGMSQDFLKGIRMRRRLVAALILLLFGLYPATVSEAITLETQPSAAEATLKLWSRADRDH